MRQRTRTLLKPILLIFTDACAVFAVHMALRGYANILYTCRLILDGDLSYTDASELTWTVILSLVLMAAARNIIFRGHSRVLLAEIILTAVVITAGMYFLQTTGNITNLHINEANGSGNVRTGDVYSGDYVEIYNSGIFKCELKDIWLSDDHDELRKLNVWESTDCAELAPGEWLVIYPGGDSFGIKEDGGETVYLTAGSGNMADMLEMPATGPELVYGRTSEESDGWSLQEPTPGYANIPVTKRAEAPEFSRESGFYDDEFELTISAEPGCSIYYTTDGSIPDENSTLYTGPVRIYDRSDEPNTIFGEKHIIKDYNEKFHLKDSVDKAFVIRAVAAAPGQSVASEITTASYWVGLDRDNYSTVVSVVADKDALIGDDGIYVTGTEYNEWYENGGEGESPVPNFSRHGSAYEIPAEVLILDDGITLDQEVGLRVTGGHRRGTKVKGLRLYSRKKYSGSSTFDEEIFSGVKSHSVTTRGGYGNTIAQLISAGTHAAVQELERISLFLNGEYMADTNLIEDYDARYFREHYGIDEDSVVVCKEGVVNEGRDEDQQLYDEMYDFVTTHDMSDDENYEQFCDMADVQSYMDYMCIRVFFNDVDFTEEKNTVVWRSREAEDEDYADGRWRWALYDVDFFDYAERDDGAEQAWETNTYRAAGPYVGGTATGDHPIFAALKANEDFCSQYMETVEYLTENVLTYDRAVQIMDDYGELTDCFEEGNTPSKDRSFYEDFFRNRGKYMLEYTAEELGY